MRIPAPTGITARHQGFWAYLTVPGRRGHSIQVQYDDNGTWRDTAKQVSEYLVPMYEHGIRTQWRARYIRAGVNGDWATGRVWAPDGFEQDGSDPTPKPPQPPTGLRVTATDPEALTATVEWDPVTEHEEQFWRVELLEIDPAPRTVYTAGTTFRNLETARVYAWRVRAVYVDAEGFERKSAWSTGPQFQLDGDPPPVDPPAPPRALRVHCIHPRHAKVEWDANPPSDGVTSYLVTLDGSTQREVIGTLVEVHDLTPETDYTVQVRACRDNECSQPSTTGFTTGAEERPPEPDPPAGAPPAPTGLYLDPIAPGRVEAHWDQPPAERPVWWLATPDGGATWHRATTRGIQLDVPEGHQVRVGVAAVLDGANGMPTRLSAPTFAAVKTAQKGA